MKKLFKSFKRKTKRMAVRLIERSLFKWLISSLAVIAVPVKVLADNAYAEAGANWILDGLFWVLVVAMIGGIGMAVIKRNLTGALITLVVGGIVLVIVKDPNIIVNIGTALKGVLGL